MSSGWIKIHRSIQDKGWYKHPDYVAIWLYLILEATHEPREYFWNGKTVILRPGQFITGRARMAANTGVQESKVERILKCFESEQQIEQQKSSTSRLISIINWSKYQLVEQPFEQQMNNGRTTDEQRMNTKQELKNVRSNNIVRVEKFVEHVNKTFGRKCRTTQTVISAFNARIKVYSSQDLIAVIENIKKSTFHIESKFSWVTPEFILREKTIEKYKQNPLIFNGSSKQKQDVEPEKGQKYDPSTSLYEGWQ